MKIELNKDSRRLTLAAENARDHYLIGRISGRLNVGTFANESTRKIDIPFEDLVKALAGEK